jgi:hypothetical protein
MDIVQIVIYNLRLRREEELLAEGKEVDKDKMFFRFKEDICYFIDKNWGRVCFGKSRTCSLLFSRLVHYVHRSSLVLGAVIDHLQER